VTMISATSGAIWLAVPIAISSLVEVFVCAIIVCRQFSSFYPPVFGLK
jgi:hypothetical protein